MDSNVKRWSPERIVILAALAFGIAAGTYGIANAAERLGLERLVRRERHPAVRRERPGRRPQRGAAVGPAAERRDAVDR